jgi:methyl-accepting chemotaxis protein
MSTEHDQQLLQALTALKNGDLSVRLPTDQEGTAREIADTFNTTMEQLNSLSTNVLRLMKELGPQSRLGGQVWVDDLSGTWKAMQEQMDETAALLTNQVRNFNTVASKLLSNEPTDLATVPAEGEMALLKSIINCLIQKYGTVKEKVAHT